MCVESTDKGEIDIILNYQVLLSMNMVCLSIYLALLFDYFGLFFPKALSTFYEATLYIVFLS